MKCLKVRVIICYYLFSFFLYVIYAYCYSLFGITLEQESRVIRRHYLFLQRVFGLKVNVVGKRHLSLLQQRNVIVICNHSSALDIPFVYIALPTRLHVRMVAKKELFRIPLFGALLRRYNFVPLDRDNIKKAINSLNKSIDYLEKGYSILFFPEGTRSQDGALQPFKKGAFKLAVQANALILPIGIVGANKALPPGRLSALQLGAEVTVNIGEPIDTRGYSDATIRELMSASHEIVSRLSTMGSGDSAESP